MNYVIEVATDIEEYLEAWNRIMFQFYWYRESPIFDWNKEEYIDDTRREFHDEAHRFLIARNTDSKEVVAVMGMRVSKPEAVIYRWEPAVKDGLILEGIGFSMIQEGVSLAKEIGCETVRIVQKYPLSDSDAARRLIQVYEEIGLRDPHAPSAGLIMNLTKKKIKPIQPSNIGYTTRAEFMDEELADLVVRCFTSTEEDRMIHMKDAGVADPEVTRSVLQRTREGGYGESPPECTHIALENEEPVGIVGSFIRPNTYHPRTGVLGPVGVLPEVRRKGVASFLVTIALKTLKEKGCIYAAVGTPENNLGAIQMYQRCGFEDRDRLVRLRINL